MEKTDYPNFSGEDFRGLANGFFQAEGTVTARIRSKGFISPIITLNQNLSKQSLAFFVTL